MKRLLLVLASLAVLPAHAIEVFATVPEWAALAREIGGDKATIFVATHALQDPHRIEARPSLIARARRADLVVATGAELETGWLPVVLRESGNAGIQPGRPGYFEAAAHVRMLDVPATRPDRAEGDVHAAGNPHIQTDPRNILKVAEVLAERLAMIDAANAAVYRTNLATFADQWRAAISRWEREAMPLKGMAVVVQHKSWTYLSDWLGLKEVAALEAKPGLEPSAASLARLVEQTAAAKPRMVVRAAYNSARPAEWFSAQAKMPVAVLPFTVGGNEAAKDLFGLFDDTVRRLVEAAK